MSSGLCSWKYLKVSIWSSSCSVINSKSTKNCGYISVSWNNLKNVSITSCKCCISSSTINNKNICSVVLKCITGRIKCHSVSWRFKCLNVGGNKVVSSNFTISVKNQLISIESTGGIIINRQNSSSDTKSSAVIICSCFGSIWPPNSKTSTDWPSSGTLWVKSILHTEIRPNLSISGIVVWNLNSNICWRQSINITSGNWVWFRKSKSGLCNINSFIKPMPIWLSSGIY